MEIPKAKLTELHKQKAKIAKKNLKETDKSQEKKRPQREEGSLMCTQ